MLKDSFTVETPNVTCQDNLIVSKYEYQTSKAESDGKTVKIIHQVKNMNFKSSQIRSNVCRIKR